MWNLKPYSDYILYFSMILLLVFVIITGIKTVKVLKQAMPLLERSKALTENTTQFKEKKEIVSGQWENLKKNLTTLGWVAIILKAANAIYEEDETAKGLKGYSKSTVQALKNERLAEKTWRRFQKKNSF